MSVFTGVSAALPGRRREAEEFAALLENGRTPADSGLADLVALARSLAPAEHGPAPEFRSALRDRLVAEAADRPTGMPTQRTVEPDPAPRARRPRLGQAVAALTVASVVAGAGAAVASSRALPGDVLYGLKRQIENVQLALAGSDLERGRELLEQAESRLSEAERLAAADGADDETRAALATALDEMGAATEAGAAALTDAYRETGDEEPMLLLDRFVADQRQRLEELYDVLDPSLRARVVALAEELARFGASARAVLSSTAADAAGRATGDGWAVSRLLDHAKAEAAQAALGMDLAGGDPVGDATATAATAASGAGGVRGGSGGGTGDGNVLDDVVDGVTGGGTTGGGGLGGGATTVPSLPATPLPSVSAPPLPSVTAPPLPGVTAPPLPTVTSLPGTSSAPLPTGSAPLPSVSACVPPLTSC